MRVYIDDVILCVNGFSSFRSREIFTQLDETFNLSYYLPLLDIKKFFYVKILIN